MQQQLRVLRVCCPLRRVHARSRPSPTTLPRCRAAPRLSPPSPLLLAAQKEFNPKGGIIITENGCAVAEEDVDEALKDIERAVYLKRYLTEVHKALLHDDVDVRGYFVWSLLDNFEWGYGYQKKFGLHYVDMQTLERIPKMSANWYAEVIKKNRLEQA